jgi:O-antigen/teichoic acid export membrane protein
MSSKHSILRGGATLGFGQAVSQVCSFTRSIIVARLISPNDFGIAATFAMTFYLVELMSNLGMENLLIQAEDGNEPRFQGTVHLLLVLRGSINAACIFLLAGPMSSLFGAPEARWAFRCLALTPFIRGLNHLDTVRFQREMRFKPAVAVDAASSIVVTLLALPICLWRRDYSAMLWILVLQAAASRIGSNVAADRPYRWAWDAAIARRVLTFGWPLLINGLLMYIILQGDRFVIGAAKRLFAHSTYTLTDLGIYSVAFALTMAPASMVGGISTSLFLPMLSKVQSSLREFEKRYAYCTQAISMVAALIAIPFMVAGGWFVILIYGVKYALAASFIGWLAAMWALRMVRAAPTVAAMALGDTRNAMISNIARTVALAGVLLAAATGGGLVWIAVSGFVGELLALGVCVGRLQREHGVSARPFLRPVAISAIGMVLAAIMAVSVTPHLGWFLSFCVAAGLMLLQFLIMLLAFPSLRKQLGQMTSKSQVALDGEEVPA